MAYPEDRLNDVIATTTDASVAKDWQRQCAIDREEAGDWCNQYYYVEEVEPSSERDIHKASASWFRERSIQSQRQWGP